MLILFFTLLFTPFAIAQTSTDPADPAEPRWAKAEEAYGSGRADQGHRLLRQLVDDHPGDVDLAVRCLEKIRRAAGRWDSGDPWVRYAVERLAALEQLGALSANTTTTRTAQEIRLELRQREGRLLGVVEELDRLVGENPHDLSWSIARARAHRRMDTVRARPLHQKLQQDSDPEHPDPETRDLWRRLSDELKTGLDSLPAPLVAPPPPNTSPMLLAEPDDPDGLWHRVLDGNPARLADAIDQLAGEVMIEGQIVPWRDMSGLLEPARALDLHLQSLSADQLRALRKTQAANFSFELVRDAPSETEILTLHRRYPWALPAQKLLLTQANTYLWAGRAESAGRCFDNLLAHAVDPALRDAARVGSWIVLAQLGRHDELAAAIGETDPEAQLPWMGKTATSREIATHLKGPASNSALRTPQSAFESPAIPHSAFPIHLPPVPPWPTDQPAAGSTVDLAVSDGQLIVSSRNLLASYDANSPGVPQWAQIQRHPIEERRRTGYYAGYFRPTLAGDDGSNLLFSRWGFESLPNAIAAFDRATGRPLWASASANPNEGKRRRDRTFAIPIGDPVFADGLLFYLQWNTRHDVNDKRGRELALVCFDPQRRAPLWESTIAIAGHSSDIVGNFESANPNAAIYGNRVTIHRGAVYSSSNAGFIARCDIRDGRTDWIHYYRRRGTSARNLGCAPVVAGDRIVCMPRDANRVFALDRQTGRLVWDNPLTAAVESLGLIDGDDGDPLLIVRGASAFTALDVATGEARWVRPLDEPVIGRAQLLGKSIFFAHADRLHRLDALSGTSEESRPWNLGDERALGFTIAGEKLYVVSDKPADDPLQKVAQPLNPDAPVQSSPIRLPLRQTWTLQRSDARIILPPEGSPFAGSAFVLAGGILERIDLSPRGAIHWRRFVDARDAKLHLVGDKLLLRERRRANVANRAIAFGGAGGRVLWDTATTIPPELERTLQCGSHQLFHDGRGRLAAIDLATGKQTWQRHLGEGQLLQPHWDGARLHVFHTTLRHGARHFVIDPGSGELLVDRSVKIKTIEGIPTNGRPLGDGYFEVAFPPVEARFVKLVTLSEVNGRGWASAAEFHVVGADGKRLDRDGWSARADSSESKSIQYTPSPDKAIDGDPTTWWHTQWLDGIPDHPHEYIIDFGAPRTVEALHYLPAVIVNNNGMIRDYELHASTDGKQWGEAVARGVMVNRVHIQRAFFTDNGNGNGSGAMFFESHDHRKRITSVFRYALDEQPAIVVAENAHILEVSGKYVLLNVRESDKESLVVLSASDPDYRFDLEPHVPRGRSGEVYIDGDHLILAQRKIVVADLARKSWVITPGEDKEPHNQHGLVVRTGPDTLLKFVHRGNRGQELTEINLRTGALSTSMLDSQPEPLKLQGLHQARRNQQSRALVNFDQTLLFNDGATLTAWIADWR